MNIDDFVSKPVSPSQLLDSIQRIFSRRNDITLQTLAAQNKGIDPAGDSMNTLTLLAKMWK